MHDSETERTTNLADPAEDLDRGTVADRCLQADRRPERDPVSRGAKQPAALAGSAELVEDHLRWDRCVLLDGDGNGAHCYPGRVGWQVIPNLACVGLDKRLHGGPSLSQ